MNRKPGMSSLCQGTNCYCKGDNNVHLKELKYLVKELTPEQLEELQLVPSKKMFADHMKVYVVIEKVSDKAETRDHICYIFNSMEEAIRYVSHVRATSKSVVRVEEHELYSSFECNIIAK